MKDKIYANIDENHTFISDTNIIGRQGENLCTQLEIALESCLCDAWVFLKFKKSDGTIKITEKLEIVDNVVTYDIGNDLLDANGNLSVLAELHKDTGLVWKSTIKTYKVLNSYDGTDQIENKEDFITNAQTLIEEIENGLTPTIGDNGNWFISNKDTGKSSVGLTGEPGKDGVDGYTPVKGTDYFDGKDGVDGKDYVISQNDYEEIGSIVEANIQPTLENNLKEAKDYTDNAIIKDFKDISYNEKTATIVFTRHDNTTFTIDLPIEQTVKDGRYDDETNELILVLVSGQEIKIPVTGLIDDYDGVDTATIQCVVSADNKISCNIKSGSITKTLLTADLQNEISNKVNNTDYATSSKAGLLRPANGLFTSGSTGALLISKASTAQIDAKTDNYYPIVPSNLDYAVKSVVGGHVTLTQAEYDALETKDENTFYYIVEE